MSEYLSGADALADGRLRKSELPRGHGVLFVEGRDDVRVFSRHVALADAVIPCGSKGKVLDAHARATAEEAAHFMFIVDCDYDVPGGNLRPAPNLVVTANVDIESDLLSLGALSRIVVELVPAAGGSLARAEVVAGTVMARAGCLADALGQMRQVSAVEGLGLSFEKLKYRRYRRAGTCEVYGEKLARVLLQRAPVRVGTAEELWERAAGVERGPRIRHGKDLLGAVGAVLHDDFGVPVAGAAALPQLLRMSVDDELLGKWPLARRVRGWEDENGHVVFRR